jgi:hypothetical protein
VRSASVFLDEINAALLENPVALSRKLLSSLSFTQADTRAAAILVDEMSRRIQLGSFRQWAPDDPVGGRYGGPYFGCFGC